MARISQTHQAGTIHCAGCETWNLPNEPGIPPDSMLNDELAAYLVKVIPVYESLSHLTGQLGALLLLSMHRKTRGLNLDHTLYCDARSRLAEIEDGLAGISPPEAVGFHFCTIGKVAKTLAISLGHIEHSAAVGNIERRDEMVPMLNRSLHKAHTLLKQSAAPNMGLSSVDYDNTCCSCTGVNTHLKT